MLICSLTASKAEDADNGICLCNSALHSAEAWLCQAENDEDCTTVYRKGALISERLTLLTSTHYSLHSLYYALLSQMPILIMVSRSLQPSESPHSTCISFFRRTGPPEGPNWTLTPSFIRILILSQFLVHVPYR